MTTILQEGKKDKLNYYVSPNRDNMGMLAAQYAAKKMKEKLSENDEVRVIFASAPSQNEFLHHLTSDEEIDWSRVVGSHMDEYLGLPRDSDQRFSIYLENHLLNKVSLKEFHFIDGTKDPSDMESLYTTLLTEKPIDVVCLGVGENGHIAFNDPPVADFNDPKMVKIVELDQYSRRQQVNDGCFASIEEVPTHALSLTIPALISAETMVCTVPGPTKQEAIAKMLNDEISTDCPATILRKHEDAYLFLDREAYGGI